MYDLFLKWTVFLYTIYNYCLCWAVTMASYCIGLHWKTTCHCCTWHNILSVTEKIPEQMLLQTCFSIQCSGYLSVVPDINFVSFASHLYKYSGTRDYVRQPLLILWFLTISDLDPYYKHLVKSTARGLFSCLYSCINSYWRALMGVACTYGEVNSLNGSCIN